MWSRTGGAPITRPNGSASEGENSSVVKRARAACCNSVTEGWLEIDKHYSLELCFSIEKQPETVW